MEDKLPTPDDLSGDCVYVTPQEIDWGAPDLDPWESYSPAECPTCGRTILSREGGADCPHCDEWVETDASGPMMSYFYPLPEASADDAMKLDGLPLCLVYFDRDESWALALTGGGMDLSWEICEAFIRLGYLPPRHFARDLPAMAGLTWTPRVAAIVAACQDTQRVVRMHAEGASERLESLERALQEGR